MMRYRLWMIPLLIVALAGCQGSDEDDDGGLPEDGVTLDGSDPGADPGADPGSDPGSDPGADPGADPGSDPGSDPGADPGSDPGADIETHPCDPGVPVSTNRLGDTEMLIVTDTSLASAFEVLADWKNSKGVPTEVVTTTWIDQNVSGEDGAARIREHIRSLFASGDLDYVLLGGDSDVVPYREVQSSALLGSYAGSFATDFYFSDLDGTWNDNGGAYGQVDDGLEMHPDVAVARAPVSTGWEAETFVGRVLAYEQTNPGYAKDALFISEDTGFLNFDSALQLDPLANDTFPADFTKQKLYWKYQNYPDSQENTYQAQVDALNTGKGFVTHYGHASEYDLNMEMSVSDVSILANSPHFPVYVSCGCLAGNFSYSSMDTAGENLFTNPSGGAVAYLGNTDIGLGPAGGTAFIQAFYQALFDGHDRLGDAMFVARNTFFQNESTLHNEILGTRWTQFVVVLFGDPEMPVWTGIPGVVTAQHADALPRGEQCLEVQAALDGVPRSGILVTAYRAGEFLFSQETDAQGKTTFRFSSSMGGEILVTATYPQSVPALSSLTVP